jgi:hypothetical protein
MLRKLSAALVAVFASGLIAYATNLPLVPSTSQFNEPSQIVSTLNAAIQQLNGQAGYTTATPIVGTGLFCQNAAAGASPQVCNGGRGAVAFTTITVAATGTNQTIVVTNSAITTASVCHAQFITAFTAGSAVVVGPVTPTAGSMSIVIANAGATTNAVTTGTLGFGCDF